ncbi:SAGA-associated factor 29-like [Pollicipes pollicipes]|uniref:SAGA-associated factor 29-like n=1 Tax=Pollicipes pollicipes TaxID=41117 RepID=UPI001884B370|nr:SAGA-associated factor 29-like [Pollicipes pollicipes]XP_037089308.1 SAGA-associated factor 29-like [Pollicipes pollicipes]
MGRTPGAKNKCVGSPRSPKAGEGSASYRRLRLPELVNMSLTPYPLSLSTEMVMAMNAEAGTIQDKLKIVSKSISDIEAERKKGDPNLEAINALHDKIQQDGKLTPMNKMRLKSMYVTARGDAEREAELIRSALATIYEIRSIRNELRLQAKHSGNKETIRRGALMKMLQNTAQTLPLWIGSPGDEPPALCGAVQAEPNYAAKAGDMVAALVRGSDGEENWILAEVISYNSSSNKYEVEDIDEEQRERMILSRRRVIPLPTMRANPDTQPEALFQETAVVNAIYPQTTCFYKGVVKTAPATAVDDYEILFEDSSYTDGFAPPLRVAQRYVIVYREKKNKKE